MPGYEENLANANKEVEQLRSQLVEVLDFRSVSKKRAKMPVNALLFLYGIEWRTEELARRACEAFASGDVVVAIILTRGVIENAAAAWDLMDLLTSRADAMTDDELREYTLRLLLGHKTDEEMPKAVNVMSMLDRASKTLPQCRQNYERLSEFAHPNWSGVMAAYIKTNKEALSAEFGRNPRMRSTPSEQGVLSLLAGLAMLQYASTKIKTAIPGIVERVERSLSN